MLSCVQVAKENSVTKTIGKLKTWYFEKDGKF